MDPVLHRGQADLVVSELQVSAWMQAAGFANVRARDLFEDKFFLVYSRLFPVIGAQRRTQAEEVTVSEANKAIVREVYASLNAGKLDKFEAVLAENVVEHDEFPGLEPTREGVVKFFQIMRAAFPDLAMRIDDMIAEGDKVFVRATMTGTHQGTFMDIPATGRTIAVPLGDYVRFENGKVAEHWGVTDTGKMMEQLQG